jgi:hypothetical protein
MGPPPEPSARRVPVASLPAAVRLLRLLLRLAFLTLFCCAAGTSRRRAAPWPQLQVASIFHAPIFVSFERPVMRLLPASVIDSSKVASVRGMWQVCVVNHAHVICQSVRDIFVPQRRASLDQAPDAAVANAAVERRGSVSSAAERDRRGSSSSQQLPQLECSDRIRFLVAALADVTKNAAAAMELQVPAHVMMSRHCMQCRRFCCC